ncbi:hypothetical protein GQ42DRAFT_85651, partial [Ramicandelaber brevisporus]
QTICLVKQAPLHPSSRHPNRLLATLFTRIYEELHAQTIHMSPCILAGIRHDVSIPMASTLQITLSATAIGRILPSHSFFAASTLLHSALSCLDTSTNRDHGRHRSVKANHAAPVSPPATTVAATAVAATVATAPSLSAEPCPIELCPLAVVPGMIVRRSLGRISMHFVREEHLSAEPRRESSGLAVKSGHDHLLRRHQHTQPNHQSQPQQPHHHTQTITPSVPNVVVSGTSGTHSDSALPEAHQHQLHRPKGLLSGIQQSVKSLVGLGRRPLRLFGGTRRLDYKGAGVAFSSLNGGHTPISGLPVAAYAGSIYAEDASTIGAFAHEFLNEVLAVVRAHVAALGGNSLIAMQIEQSFVTEESRHNGYALICISGDVAVCEPIV